MKYLELTKTDMKMERLLLNAYKNAMKYMPDGRLGVRKIRGKWRYYRIDEQTQRQSFIPKADLRLIHQLKQKRWMKKAIKILEKT